jgi:hypothetical protein
MKKAPAVPLQAGLASSGRTRVNQHLPEIAMNARRDDAGIDAKY